LLGGCNFDRYGSILGAGCVVVGERGLREGILITADCEYLAIRRFGPSHGDRHLGRKLWRRVFLVPGDRICADDHAASAGG